MIHQLQFITPILEQQLLLSPSIVPFEIEHMQQLTSILPCLLSFLGSKELNKDKEKRFLHMPKTPSRVLEGI
jgi:hypothetical protein